MIRELQHIPGELVLDSQEIAHIWSFAPTKVRAGEDLPTGIVVKACNGSITSLWATWDSRPWRLQAIYENFLEED